MKEAGSQRPAWMNLDYQSPWLAQNQLYHLPEGVDPLHRIIDWALIPRGLSLDPSDPERDLQKIFDLENLPSDRPDLKKSALILEAILKYKYMTSVIERNEHLKPQCEGPYNFGMTIRHAYNMTHDPEAVGAVTKVLVKIADWPSAGSCAWELRRFIRRANSEQVVEYLGVINEMVERFPERLHGGLFLSMDDLYWQGSGAVPEEIERARLQLRYLETGVYNQE